MVSGKATQEPLSVTPDVLVVGGGIAGLVFVSLLARAASVRRRGLQIAILDRRPPLPPGEEIGLRVLALAPASRRILEAAGAWQALPAERIAPYRHMRVWQAKGTPDGPGSLSFDAADHDLTELGHIVEHDLLRHLLWDAVKALPGVQVITGGTPQRLDTGPEAMTLLLDDDRSLSARLVVGADGVDSWVRKQLGLDSSGRSYGQRAIVTHVAGERPHGDTAWQCFHDSGPVALLPLADGRSSVVWSCPDDEAADLLDCGEEEFAARLGAATGQVLGRLQVRAGRAAFPLAVRHTHRYTGARFALLGDAAHQIHPLAGQGINLGLLDAAALAETLDEHMAATTWADPGDLRVLRRYERWRKGDNLLTLGAMEALHRLFTSRRPLVTRLGSLGLGMVDRMTPVKYLFAEQALGRAGRLPVVAAGRSSPPAGQRRPDAEI